MLKMASAKTANNEVMHESIKIQQIGQLRGDIGSFVDSEQVDNGIYSKTIFKKSKHVSQMPSTKTGKDLGRELCFWCTTFPCLSGINQDII